MQSLHRCRLDYPRYYNAAAFVRYRALPEASAKAKS
jgi:hypothetical protein